MQVNDTSFYTTKVKIILLGDPTVGKTSIISAIRQLDFREKQEVHLSISRLQLASIFLRKSLVKVDKLINCNSGTRLDRKGSEVSSRPTLEMRILASLCLTFKVTTFFN